MQLFTGFRRCTVIFDKYEIYIILKGSSCFQPIFPSTTNARLRLTYAVPGLESAGSLFRGQFRGVRACTPGLAGCKALPLTTRPCRLEKDCE